MILTNLLDDLGIQSNNDSNDGPNLIQGQELMKYERNYNAEIEPNMKLLESGSTPDLGFVNEGFSSETEKCDANVLSKDLTHELNHVQKALHHYEKASSKYKESLKDIKSGDPTYFNSVLVNNSRNVISVYDEQLKEKVIGYVKDADRDNNEWGPTCLKIYKHYNMGSNTWGGAKNLVPIQDLFNNKCRSSDGSIISNRQVDKLIRDPMTEQIEGIAQTRNMCPLDYPIAFSGTSDGSGEKKYCCNSGVYKNECKGEKKSLSTVDGPVSDYVLKIKTQKNGSPTVYNYTLQPWNGFAIGADQETILKVFPTAHGDNGFIPVGNNRIYGGNFSIFWAHDSHNLGEENCPNDFVYMKDVRQAYMYGKIGKYGSKDWRRSFVDNTQVSGFFYISANEKIILENELVNVLGQIIDINAIMTMFRDELGNKYTSLDMLNSKIIPPDQVVDATGKWINPNWIPKNDWIEEEIPILSEIIDLNPADPIKSSGMCLSQFGAYFNSSGLNPTIKSPTQGDPLTSLNNPSALGHSLQQGGICGWNCISGCGSWSDYVISDKKKLFQSCSNNQCAPKNVVGANTFTRALIVSIQKLAMDVRGSKVYGNLSLDSLDEINKLAGKKQCVYGKGEIGYIKGNLLDQEGLEMNYDSLEDAKIGCDIAGEACAGITYNTGNSGKYQLRSGNSQAKIYNAPTGEISYLKKNCTAPDKNYDVNTLETCQDLRNAYEISNYPSKGWAVDKGDILTNGCATDDILSIYKKNCKNNTRNIIGPDSSKSRVKSRCSKDVLGSSSAGGISGGVNPDLQGDGVTIKGDNPPLTEISSVEYYPERVFINAFGYKQTFDKKLDSLKKPLEKLKKRCPVKRELPKNKKGRYVKDGVGCIPDTSGDIEKGIGFPTSNSVKVMTDKFDDLFSSCQTSGVDEVAIEMVSENVYKKQGKIDPVSETSRGNSSKTNLDDMLDKNSDICPTQIQNNNGENVPIVGQIVKTETGKKIYWIDLEGHKIELTEDLILNTSLQDRCISFPPLVGNETTLGGTSNSKFMNILSAAPKIPDEVLKYIPERTTAPKGGSLEEEICASYDRTLYEEVKNAGRKLAKAVQKVQDKLQTVESQNSACKEQRTQVEEHLAHLVTNVNNDMDKLDHLELVQDTDIAREESTGLIKDSTKLQYLIWSIIGVGLLLYGMFGVSSADFKSPFHIVILVACVIILFIILRRFYLSGII